MARYLFVFILVALGVLIFNADFSAILSDDTMFMIVGLLLMLSPLGLAILIFMIFSLFM